MSLEEAASRVGVSKKSLDDYLSQLRQGRQYGFDFNRDKREKVGKLRQFVKEEIKNRGGQVPEEDEVSKQPKKKAQKKK